MRNNRKILAVAIGSAFAGIASAQIALPNTTTASPLYAAEITSTNIATTATVRGALGWGWSSGSNVYIRYDLSGGTFTADPVAPVISSDAAGALGAGATVTKASGGAGGANIIFQATSKDSANTVVTGNANITLAGITVTSGASDLTITQSVYATAADAVNGTSSGRLNTKSGTVISFTPGYTVTTTAGTAATADVANAYLGFNGSNATTPLGTFTLANGANANTATGGDAQANNILTAASRLTVTGDFTAAAHANGTFTGTAANRVFLGGTTCATAAALFANSITATTAVIPMLGRYTGAGNSTLCLTVGGNTAIAVGSYTGAFTPVANTGYTVTAPASATIGSIVRNGGQLTTPWMTLATGYVSRVVLTNSSSTAATYAVAVKGEDGNTITAKATTGTVPANGMVTINATDLASASGAQRFAATFTFTAARTAIDGAYQVVDTVLGGVSNMTLVAPGTN